MPDNDKSLLIRAISVMDTVCALGGRARFGQVAEALENPSPKTTAKILKELVQARVLVKNSDRSYSLGEKVLTWASSAIQGIDIKEIAYPALLRLNRDFELTAIMLAHEHGRMRCVCSVTDPNSPSLLEQGVTKPCVLSLLGSLYFMSKAELRTPAALINAMREHDRSSHLKRVEREQVAEIIRVFEEEGWYDDRGVLFSGVRRVGVDIAYQGRPRFVLGAGLFTGRFEKDRELYGKLKQYLQQEKQRIEDRLLRSKISGRFSGTMEL